MSSRLDALFSPDKLRENWQGLRSSDDNIPVQNVHHLAIQQQYQELLRLLTDAYPDTNWLTDKILNLTSIIEQTFDLNSDTPVEAAQKLLIVRCFRRTGRTVISKRFTTVDAVMTPLEARIAEDAWRFDLFSLLVLLSYLGYSMDEMLFCSNFSNSSQSRLVESIEFRSQPRKAIISLNLGLLGGQSVLPNYLFQQIDKQNIDTEQFTEFFGYFDDRLLRRFLLAIYPELNQSLIQNWESEKRSSLYSLKLDSVSSLHWLFQQVFPELQIRVKKDILTRNVILNTPILGKLHLGHQTVFGKRKRLPMHGSLITLITDEDSFTNGQPWTQEINQRLESLIFPLLREVGVNLDIWLVIRSQGSALSLKQNSYLGYENIHSDKLQFRRIRIFSGYLTY